VGQCGLGKHSASTFRSIHEDFRTLEIVQKAKRGELQDHMKTRNADSRQGRVVDLSEPLAAMLRDFVGGRTSGLVFCKPDGSQLMQRDILKHSLHPILKKLGLEQGGFNIFRRFRITELETAEVPAALQHTWSGHAKSHVSEVYKKLLNQREWRLRGQKKWELGSRCRATSGQRRRLQMASLARFWNSEKWDKSFRIWWTRGDSNPRPPRCERGKDKAKMRCHNHLAF
jgi:hypothetical protein